MVVVLDDISAVANVLLEKIKPPEVIAFDRVTVVAVFVTTLFELLKTATSVDTQVVFPPDPEAVVFQLAVLQPPPPLVFQ